MRAAPGVTPSASRGLPRIRWAPLGPRDRGGRQGGGRGYRHRSSHCRPGSPRSGL